MISHKHKCIFIHIPRTGGTSLEHVLFGGNWWGIEKETKHILASQAKSLYRDYWDDYFRFSFVRNPFDRCISLLNFSNIYYGSSNYEELTVEHLEWYKKKYGWPLVVEHDYRFYSREDVLTSAQSERQVYGNIIDEELDFIGRFENLEDDYKEICRLIGVRQRGLPLAAQSKLKRKDFRSYYNDDTKSIVERLYEKDLVNFGYSFC